MVADRSQVRPQLARLHFNAVNIDLKGTWSIGMVEIRAGLVLEPMQGVSCRHFAERQPYGAGRSARRWSPSPGSRTERADVGDSG